MNTPKFSLCLPIYLSLLIGHDLVIAQNDLWQPTNGPYGGRANAITVDSSRGEIFVGTVKGVFRSIDNGTTWKQIGLTLYSVTSLAIIDLCISNVTPIPKVNLMSVYKPKGIFANHLFF